MSEFTPTGTKCPECGAGELLAFTRTEEFDYDFGDETVKIRADCLPFREYLEGLMLKKVSDSAETGGGQSASLAAGDIVQGPHAARTHTTDADLAAADR